jgi:hypothetical protein
VHEENADPGSGVPAPGTGYAVTAGSQDGKATVDVPQDPGGRPIRAASDSGDVTVRQR